jgi:hypothetical protein
VGGLGGWGEVGRGMHEALEVLLGGGGAGPGAGGSVCGRQVHAWCMRAVPMAHLSCRCKAGCTAACWSNAACVNDLDRGLIVHWSTVMALAQRAT